MTRPARTVPAIVLALLLGSAIAPAQARAQSAAQARAAASAPESASEDPASAAERLFREGVALREAGDLRGAISRLRRAHRISPSALVDYNLAAALAQDGHLVEARELLRDASSDADHLLVADAAGALLRDVEARVVRVSVYVEGTNDAHEIYVDGAAARREGALLLDPGRHRIEVRASSRGPVLARSVVDVAEGESRSVVLRPVPAAALVADGAGAGARGGAGGGSGEGEEGDDTWLWVGVGAGAAAVAIAAVVIAVVASGQGGGGGGSSGSELPPVIVRGR